MDIYTIAVRVLAFVTARLNKAAVAKRAVASSALDAIVELEQEADTALAEAGKAEVLADNIAALTGV